MNYDNNALLLMNFTNLYTIYQNTKTLSYFNDDENFICTKAFNFFLQKYFYILIIHISVQLLGL